MASSKIEIEIAAQSLFSARQAQKGGANRIELCMALPTGGLTPSAGIIGAVREQVSIPIHVLVRPRLGDFVYSDLELECMIKSIAFCSSVGIDGVVVGCLAGDQVNLEQMKILAQAAKDLDLTFHRAFDLVKDPFSALEDLIFLGYKRILTSGQARTAWEGRGNLRKLQTQANGRITIMPGAGINSENIIDLYLATGCRSFHGSAKKITGDMHEDPLQITAIQGRSTKRYETDWREVAAMHKAVSDL